MNCEIIHCRYLKDFVYNVPVCRECMVNTVRRMCMNDDYISYLEVSNVLTGETYDSRISAAIKFFISRPDGFVRMENAFFKKRGYDAKQYI